MAITPTDIQITFAEYLGYNDGSNIDYELVNGKLVEMPPASFLHSDIIDFIADCFKAIALKYKLDIKIKTGDVGIRTGMNSSRIPDIAVIDGRVWRNYRRDKSAVIEDNLMLAVEVVSPGVEQVSRDYEEKLVEYENVGIQEYWIVDPIEQKVVILLLEDGSYKETIFTGDDAIASKMFPSLKTTVSEIIQQT